MEPTKLEQVFNMDVIPASDYDIVESNQQTEIVQTSEQSVEADYNHTRSNLYKLLQSGEDALQHALEIAKSSEHPRAFEVVGNLVKQLADVNHQLLDLSEKKQKLLQSSKQKEDAPTNVTNNAIFVGSTHELNKMLSNMTKGE